MINADGYLLIAQANGLPPFSEPEPADGDMLSASEVYALAHEADVAAHTVDAAHAGGQFVGDGAGDARRRAWQDRALRHAARVGPRAA